MGKGTSVEHRGSPEVTTMAEKFWFEPIWLDEVSRGREVETSQRRDAGSNWNCL